MCRWQLLVDTMPCGNTFQTYGWVIEIDRLAALTEEPLPQSTFQLSVQNFCISRAHHLATPRSFLLL